MKAQVWRNAGLATVWLEAPELGELVTRIATRDHVAPADVPDLLQETRIALWHLGLEARVNSAWIIRTATNKVVDHVRSRLRARVREQTFARLALGGSPDPDLEHLLHTEVATLPVRLRQFYELHYVWGLSEREVARELSTSRASIRWLDRCCLRAIAGEWLTRRH
jgi:DNA-directed RNA polymerase specialized sigma24 family protein